MPIEADYRWSNVKRSSFSTQPQSRARLGWWALLAILLSVLIHIFLVITFDLIQVHAWVSAIASPRDILAFKTARVTISRSALDEIIHPGKDIEEEEEVDNPTPLVDETLDEFELQELLAEMEVKLTPEVAEATRLVSSEEPTVRKGEISPTLAEVPSSTVEALDLDLSAMKAQLLKATRSSEKQPLLDINPLRENSNNPQDILDAGSSALTQGSQNTEITKGFSNLNQLLTQTGPLSDNTKPILLPTDLLFGYNEYQLREQAKLSLMRLGILIQRNPDSEFVIEGHCDTFGTVEYNQRLSELRAEAVRGWLLDSLRIDASNVRAVGFGKSRPLANPDGTIEEQELNRRVEIVINKNRG